MMARESEWRMRLGVRRLQWHRTCSSSPMAPPHGDSHTHLGHGPVRRVPPERSNWRRHGPHLRMLAVATVLTAAAASAGMLMALMGD